MTSQGSLIQTQIAQQPTIITVAHHDSVSAADILDITSSAINGAAPVAVQSVPVFTTNIQSQTRISTIILLSQIGVNLIAGIMNAIHQRSQQNQALTAQAAQMQSNNEVTSRGQS